MKTNYNKAYERKNKVENEVLDPVIEAEVTPEETEVVEEVKEEVAPKREKIQKFPFMIEVIGDLALNVRKTPNGEIFKSIPNGANAKVLEISEDGEWYLIESPKGFIKKEFTKKVK